jgi:outer membrane protein assembly factor BamB
MSNANRSWRVLVGCGLLLSATCAAAQDWPQWRGPNRDNKVVGFTAPATWPKELTQKWKVTVGLGDAWPVLTGDKVYVFTRQGADEVISCLDAGDGKIVWQDKYGAPAVTSPANSHPGPRSTPAVAEGKVCTLGVGGAVTCLDAATGKRVWQKDTKAYPRFFTSSSPLIVDGKCIVYVGALTAFDLASGEEKWKWAEDGAPYGSPVLMTVDGTKQVVTSTDKSIVGVSLADGKRLWHVPFGGNAYQNHSSTPIIDGQTVIYSGQPGQNGGTVALKIEKKGDAFEAKEVWKKPQGAGMYNTPVLKDGFLFGLITANRAPSNLFCMDAKNGEVLWKDTTPRGECGDVFDAGSVLLALTSNSELLVFKPSNKGYEELAKYKVSDKGANTGTEGTWAGPIVSGNRVFVKDKDSLTLWTIN